MTKTSCLDPVAANAYPSVTTGPRLLKILIARRDEYRDRDSDLLLPQQSSTVLGPSTIPHPGLQFEL